MWCPICRQGETAPGITTVTLNRDEAAVVVRGAPADVCDDCGEYYLSEEVAARVLSLAENALADHAEVGVLHYVA